MNMTFRCVGIPRGGHHAVIYWLLYQHEKINKFKEPHSLTVKKNRRIDTIVYDNYTAAIYLLYDTNFTTQKRVVKEQRSIIAYERGSCEQAFKQPCIEPYINIIILRDFTNFIASTIQKMHRIPLCFLTLWYDRAIAIQKKRGYFINYNRFNCETDYRKQICNDLNIAFTDIGINYISDHAGGSSFSGRDINLFQRYQLNNRLSILKQSLKDKANECLEQYPQYVELSREIFEQ